MPAARSVSDEPAVETSWAIHMRTKSRFRNTAVEDTLTPGCATPPTLPPSTHRLRRPRSRNPPAPAQPGAGATTGGRGPEREDWREVYVPGG